MAQQDSTELGVVLGACRPDFLGTNTSRNDSTATEKVAELPFGSYQSIMSRRKAS